MCTTTDNRDIRGEELRLAGARFVYPMPVATEDQEIDTSLEIAHDAIGRALSFTDTTDPEDEMLLSQALTLISRVQRRRS